MISLLLSAVLMFPTAVVYEPPLIAYSSEVSMASLMQILRDVGFSGEGLRIAYAVVMAESSGNARAHNPDASTGDNSYGLFQINMLGSMGPERRKLYGLSSNEDLFDPYVNAKVAYKMSNGGKNWQPWSTYKRGDYKDFLDGADITVKNYSGSGGGGGGGGGGSSAPEVKPLSRNETAEQYGFVESMLDAIPELRGLFNRAVSGGWTASKFQAEVRNTQWFKTHTESERQFLIKQYGDPATAGQLWHVNQLKVWSMASAVGASVDWDVVNKFAYGIMALGWDEGQLRAELAKHIALGSTSQGGQAGQVMNELKQYGYEMGWQFNDYDLQYAAQQVVGGMRTTDQYKAQIRNVAKGIYSQWSDQIDAGQTVMGLASPYFQSMSSILELPAGSITLDDPLIKNALQSKDLATGENRIKQLWEFENDLRNDERWKKTQNAQNSTMQIAHKVLSDFGFAY